MYKRQGYKGLSLGLINSVIRNWGSDCAFFFNYNRINPGLNNDIVREHMDDLFGQSRAEAIREKLIGLPPEDREDLIMKELSRALNALGATYVCHFAFKNEQGTRTKHHLIFASKNFKGYEIMKSIMAAESSERDQGVPSYEHSPLSKSNPTLFPLNAPLDDLEEMLLIEFAGQKLNMRQIYERHSVDKRYLEANYKKALMNMELAGKIEADPPAEKRREGTFGDRVIVTFPRRLIQ